MFVRCTDPVAAIFECWIERIQQGEGKKPGWEEGVRIGTSGLMPGFFRIFASQNQPYEHDR